MPYAPLPPDATPDAQAPAGYVPLHPDAQPDAPQMTGIKRPFAMAGSNLLSGIVSAMAPFASSALDPTGMGSPQDLEPMRSPSVTDLATGKPPLPSYADLATQLPGVAQQQASDLANIPSLKPKGETEENIAAASRGVGQALPFLPLGGGVLPTLAAGAGGGVGGRYGEKVGDYLGYPKTGAVLGSFLGGAGAGSAAGGLNKVYNAATSQFMPLGEAYKEAGVPMIMTGDVSGSPSLQTIQAGASKALGGAGRTHEAGAEVLDAFNHSAESTAAQLGNSSTVQELGDKVQAAGKGWIDNFKQTSNAAQSAVDQQVGAQTPVIMSATQQLLGDIKSKAAGNPELERFLTSPLAADVNKVVEAAPQGPWGGPAAPWSAARALRSRIGEYLENPGLIADAGSAQAKRIYGALTTDLRGTAAANPAALSAFDSANAQTTAGHQFIENTLSPLMNKSSPQAAQSILSSLNSGDQTIGQLRQQMPQIANEVGAFKLRDMAAATAGQQNAAGNAVSPASFLTDWSKMAPEAKAALYQDPAVASKINALARISDSIKQTAKMANTSGSTHQAALLSVPLLGIEGAAKGYEMGGFPGAVGGALSGGLLMPATGRGLSYLGANRWLAPLLAAQGKTLGPGQSGLLGILSGARQPDLLAPSSQ